ncbi:hypothetical protein [Acinetobacter nectaris]|uniref:hypothetical protein n=1 Tax=Acinetobacter nectaris TaxID=1219382 RepID=UPI001F2CD6D8|nr:hypothetical protein [Acinetobacter nectaris]MCF9034217.1 hypothetical protein [Acinetobacter nectaris]
MPTQKERDLEIELELIRQKGAIAVAAINNAVSKNINSGVAHLGNTHEEQLIKFIKEVQATLD